MNTCIDIEKEQWYLDEKLDMGRLTKKEYLDKLELLEHIQVMIDEFYE